MLLVKKLATKLVNLLICNFATNNCQFCKNTETGNLLNTYSFLQGFILFNPQAPSHRGMKIFLRFPFNCTPQVSFLRITYQGIEVLWWFFSAKKFVWKIYTSAVCIPVHLGRNYVKNNVIKIVTNALIFVISETVILKYLHIKNIE